MAWQCGGVSPGERSQYWFFKLRILQYSHIWLVVYLPLWKIYSFVSWDEIPNWMESHKIPWFQTTNQLAYLVDDRWPYQARLNSTGPFSSSKPSLLADAIVPGAFEISCGELSQHISAPNWPLFFVNHRKRAGIISCKTSSLDIIWVCLKNGACQWPFSRENPPTPAFAKAGAAPGTIGGVECFCRLAISLLLLANKSNCFLLAFKPAVASL